MSRERIERLIASGICPAENAPGLVNELLEFSKGFPLRELKRAARIFKSLSDPRRLKILKLLGHRDMCVCEINVAMDISQPAVSHHLNILENSGLVRSERRGKWIFYSIHPKTLDLVESVRNLAEK
ncbi:MAG: ArsR/SmtB family transcription factor [Candidatus Geothermarchaeales archaeon]